MVQGVTSVFFFVISNWLWLDFANLDFVEVSSDDSRCHLLTDLSSFGG